MEATLTNKKINKCIYWFDRFAFLFLIWSVLQDIVLGFLYTFIPSEPFIKVLFYLKDIMMVLMFIYAVLRLTRKNNKYFKIMVFYFLWVFFEFLFGVLVNKASIMDAAASTRGFILLPCFFLIGYSIKNKDYFTKKFTWFLEKFLIFVAIVGIVEFLLDLVIGTKGFWLNTVGFTAYMTDIKGQADRLVFGLPGNFYGSYGGAFFSQKRLVSFWGGPLTAGYVLMMPLMYYLIKVLNEKKGWIKLIISAVAIILTYTRAMILLCAIMAFFLIVFYKKNYRLLLIVIPIGIVFIGWKWSSIVAYLYDGSTYGHIISVVNSFKQISLFGTGFGTFGIYSSVGTESTYLSCLGQTGILGFILYLMLNIYLARRLRILYLLKKDNLALALYVIQLIYMASGLISEQLTASTTMLPFYIMSGFYVGKYTLYEHQRVNEPKPAINQQVAMES